MNLVISIAEHEKEMAHRWFDWCLELGGTDGHNLYLIPAADAEIKSIYEKANKAFNGRVWMIIDNERYSSDWQSTEPMRSAAGPNSSFRQVAWHFYLNKLGPYFWCELDCIPLKKGWLSQLEEAYSVAVKYGKPFMGAHVLLESVPEHMSGNAVYPQNVPEEAPTLVMRTEWTPKGQDKSFELAFDIAGARETVPKAHWTNLIQHKFRHPGFRSRKEFDDTIDPNAVVFHSCKDGSIYHYLRGGEDEIEVGIEAVREVMADPLPEPTVQPVGAAQPTFIDSDGTQYDLQVPPAQNKFGSPELQIRIEQEDKKAWMEDHIQRENGNLEPPWKNKAESEREVRLLCEALALFAKAPVYKARVRQALRDVKIIK